MTSSPSPSAPFLSASATADDAGARVFAGYFWQVYNYAYATLDTGPLASISAAGCKFCQSTISDVEGIRRAAQHVTGGAVTLRSILTVSPDIATQGIVTAEVRQEDLVVKNSAGATLSVSPGQEHLTAQIAMAFKSSWKVFGVDVSGS